MINRTVEKFGRSSSLARIPTLTSPPCPTKSLLYSLYPFSIQRLLNHHHHPSSSTEDSHPLFPFGISPKPAKPKPRPKQSPKPLRYYPFQRYQQAASAYTVEQLLNEFWMTSGEWKDARLLVGIFYFQANFRLHFFVIRLLMRKRMNWN